MMLWTRVRNAALAALAAAFLSGCGDKGIAGLTPVRPANNDAIVKDYSEFVTQWAGIKGDNDQERAKRYVTHGYDLADRSCLQYFTKLRQIREDTTFASDALSGLFAASGVIAGLTGAASTVLVGIFAGSGLVPSTVQSFNNIYLLAAVADDLYPSVATTMADYRAKHPADGTEVQNFSITRYNAQQLVQEYASLCSLSAMTATINNGVSNLCLSLDLKTGATTAAKPKVAANGTTQSDQCGRKP